ncbi:MAG: metallophosphoesterase [Clostridia bacterium]|nr:metallophosphoesterase [Clostridia bacterium]MBQ7897836.1 metallophosphoesterase [Clostridia bacterium]
MFKNRIFSIVMAFILIISAVAFTAFADDTTVSEDTTVTFGVFSDIHKQPLFLERVMNDLITMADGKENIDGLALVGDIVYFQQDETPEASFYDMLDENENYQYFVQKDVVSFAMGNHEFPISATDETVCDLSKEVFTQEIGQAPESHKIIGGYHFITAGPDTYMGEMSAEQEQYVMDEVAKALEDGTDKPIFVLIHHPIDDTLYNTADRGRNTDEFTAFLKANPRLVVISGHNHYPISNPRSIYQVAGGATFMYTSSVNSGNKLSDPYATERHATSYPSQAYIMQIDSATNVVTMKRFYVTSDNTPTWIEGGDWVLDIPAMIAESAKEEIDLSVYKYTYDEREASSTAPIFNEGDEITVTSLSTKDISFTFPAGTPALDGEDNYVGYYKIEAYNKETGETVTKKIISDYFMPKNRRTTYSCSLSGLIYDTEYTLSVYPVNMWYVEGTPITVDFKTGGLPGGFGTIVGYDDTYYAAPATLNNAGNGLNIDTDSAFQITSENNHKLAGLYAVSTDQAFGGNYDIVYVYGEYNTRSTFLRKWAEGELNPATSSAVDSSWVGRIKGIDSDKFYPGIFGGKGPFTTMTGSFYTNELSTTGSHLSVAKTKNVYFYSRSWDEAIAEAEALAAGNETNLATYLANLESFYGQYFKADSHSEFIDATTKTAYESARATYLGNVITTVQSLNMKYAYASDQIVPISEVNSLSYNQVNRQGCLSYKEKFSAKIVAYVLLKDGTVTKCSAYTSAHDLSGTWRSRSINFETASWTPALPTEGYLVGFQLYPFAGMTDPEKLTTVGRTPKNCTSDPASYSIRVRFNGTYSIDVPQVPKPDYLSVDENGKLAGTAEGTVYMYAPISSADMLNGESLTYTSVNADTTFPAGLYSVKVLGIEGECTDSEPYVLFVSGTAEEQKEIGNLVITETAATIQTKATDDWMAGYWTGDSGYVLPFRSAVDAEGNLDGWPSNYCVTSSGQHVTADSSDRAGQAKAAVFKYAYDGNEIIPADMLASFGYRAFIRSGNDKMMSTASPKSKFIIYVLNLDTTVSEYTAMSSCSSSNSKTDTVLASAFNLPEEGYIIGIQCYPYYEFDEAEMGSGLASFELMFDPADYVLKTQHTTPVVTINSKKNTLTISNYDEDVTYAYSADNGETWTEHTSKTLTLTRANTYYQVKALADDSHFESEVATATTPSAVMLFKGASLILDGQIGLKFYFDIDKSVAHKNTQTKFSVYDGSTVISSKVGYTFINKWNGWNYASYEADGRTAYFTVYVSPKDYENVYVKFDWIYAYTDSSTFVSLAPSTEFSVSSYIDSFNKQVEAGNEECIAANGLVKALEAYCKNADNFFDTADALDEVAADTSAIQNITNPAKTTTYTENAPIEHHSTSLILEDTVSIRHYFKVNDETVLEGLTSDASGFSVENIITAESSNKYLFVDIPDIDAGNLDTRYTVTLTDSDGNEISVTYSVLNYVKLTYNSTDAKLKNLARAIYNYSVEAEKYIK